MTEKIRVLFAIGSMGGGGAERQVIEILKHLDRRRFVPLLYLIAHEGELLSELPADVPVFAFRERHQSRLRIPGWNQWLRRRDLVQVLREQRIDVVYDRTYLMTLITAAATRVEPVPRISACVADPEVEVKQHARICNRLSYWNARRAYAQATCVLANSHGLRDRVAGYFKLPADHVRVMPNVVDFGRIDRLAAARDPGFEPGRFHIVSIGRLHPEKGYLYLLAAIDDLVHRRGRQQIVWHIFGKGPFEAEFRTEVVARGLNNHVLLEGFAPNPFPALRAAQLFCLPSLNEGLPNVLIEAAVCRTPLLAADCRSGPREILDGGRVGRLVPPANAPALADAIDDCLSNYPAWQSQVEAARRHVELTYSLPSGMARLQELLEQAASSRMGRQ